jgi:hypothetical protein
MAWTNITKKIDLNVDSTEFMDSPKKLAAKIIKNSSKNSENHPHEQHGPWRGKLSPLRAEIDPPDGSAAVDQKKPRALISY